MSAPTVQQLAMRMLRYIGVTSLLPQAAGSELESLGPGDLDDVANAITAALQEIASVGPLEAREVPGFAVLHAPTAITLSVTGQSNAITFSGWQSWMQGCTVRIAGDDQDNELLSQTALARAYMGSTASGVTATVYGDTITLDDTIGKIAAPLWLPNELPLWPAKDRFEFLRLGGYPLVTDVNGLATGLPFYLYYRKPVARPWTWFIDAAYDASLGYTQRRIRFSPMPDQAYSVAYTAGMNPPRVTAADIVSPLQTLVVSGAGTSAYNQSYSYAGDVAGFRAFLGETDNTRVIYYNPLDTTYVLTNVLSLLSVSSVARWTSDQMTSVLTTFSPQSGASGMVTVTSSDAGGGAGDPGTLLPIPNSWAESILLPMALRRFSASPVFKNSAALPLIERQYKAALAVLKDSRGQEATTRARYL